jgi:ferredoxin
MARGITVTVDHAVCVGNGMCREIAPKGFVEEPEDGRSSPGDPDAESLETILEAAASCPVGAITVIDADTGEELDF